MIYTRTVDTPLGLMQAAAEAGALSGLWFRKQKYFPAETEKWTEAPDYPVFESLRSWLQEYFTRRKPDIKIPLTPKGSDFRQVVWKLLLEIPYGQTSTYGALAARLPGGRRRRRP